MESNNIMFANYPDIVNPKQLQEMLGICRSKTYSLLQNGEIKSKKIGSEYRIAKANVIKYLEEV